MDVESGIVYFKNELACAPLCVEISIEPCKIENTIWFKIESTFTNSYDQLILRDPWIEFLPA